MQKSIGKTHGAWACIGVGMVIAVVGAQDLELDVSDISSNGRAKIT